MAIFSISHSESGKKLLTLKSPVDLSHIDTYECTSAEEIATIMTQAKVAQSEWKKTTLKERVELMHRVADVVIQQQKPNVQPIIQGYPSLNNLITGGSIKSGLLAREIGILGM